MSWLRRFCYGLGGLFSKSRLEREMADEMREHLEERAEHYINRDCRRRKQAMPHSAVSEEWIS